MTEALYLRDAYVTEFSARVAPSAGDGVLLDRTAFYPTGGGQPSDRGRLTATDGRIWSVRGVEKSPEGILHQLEGEPWPKNGEAVTGSVDWARRYVHMRYHTALHVLSGAVFHRFGSGITGGQITDTGARMDFSLPEFQRTVADELVAEANRVIERDLAVQVRFISRAEADALPDLVRVARDLVPAAETVRLIDIEGFDVQADGGTHVRRTAEVGAISLDRIDNKGSRNKRMYVRLGAAEGVSPSAPDLNG